MTLGLLEEHLILLLFGLNFQEKYLRDFVGDIEAPRKMETWFNYEARGTESCHLDGSRNALIELGADKES